MNRRSILGISVLAILQTGLVAGCYRATRPVIVEPPPAPDQPLDQAQLRADVRQLVGLLESAHPDPYGGRGKLAFHRDVHGVLDAIGPQGATVEEFHRLLRPLVASLGDGHTTIRLPSSPGDDARAWLDLEPVDGSLVVSRVYREQDRSLLGGEVLLLGGLGVADLRERMSRMRGTENPYSELAGVARTLEDSRTLGELLEWDSTPDRLAIQVRLRGIDLHGEIPLGRPPEQDGFVPPSAIQLPEPNAAGMAWGFLDPDGSVAYLRIDSMMRYREAFEVWRETGFTSNLGSHLTEVATAATGGPLPDGVDDRIALVPSGAEMFTELFTAMEDAGTRHLLVDLRRNSGGQSYLALVLAHFLHGTGALARLDDGYQVRRYSQLYLDNYTTHSVESLRDEGFELGDYDFSGEQAWQKRQRDGLPDDELAARVEEVESWLAYAPTVARILEAGGWDAHWTPEVTVLTSAWTHSAGFDVAVTLHKLGARLVGVPPRQAGNCYIDTLGYRLTHSGLGGSISYKRSLLFPGEPRRGAMLRPDQELTLEDLEAMDFDPEATVRLALAGLERAEATTRAEGDDLLGEAGALYPLPD